MSSSQIPGAATWKYSSNRDQPLRGGWPVSSGSSPLFACTTSTASSEAVLAIALRRGSSGLMGMARLPLSQIKPARCALETTGLEVYQEVQKEPDTPRGQDGNFWQPFLARGELSALAPTPR